MICTFYTKGWNSWNHFHCNINEAVVRQTADAIVASGLAAAGYQYGMLFYNRIYARLYFLTIFYSEHG
jgi:hypothetical protein